MDSREALIYLNLIPGLGSATIHRLLAAFESPSKIFQAAPSLLREILGRYATEEVMEKIRAAAPTPVLEEELQRAEEVEVQIVTLLDSDYPEALRNIPDPPPILYVKGTVWPEDALSVAVVGTRSASSYGLNTARQLAYDLARSGVTIVSGLAEGIDGAGHEGALDASGRTVAVLGHGLNHVYPPHHRELADRIAESGALISEFPMEMSPDRMNFPRRNRVIAGLSLGVIVVEAPIKSGALITAREALEQGKEVFAVPGPVSSERSRGCHALLKDGAKLVETAQDVLQELAPKLKEKLKDSKGILPSLLSERPKISENLTQEEAVLLEAIPQGAAAGMEMLSQLTAHPPSRLLTLLTRLELNGWIRQIPGQGYSRER